MEKLYKNKYFFPLFLLIVCLITFGLFIPFLGYFWDDFPYLWFRHSTGVSGVMQAIALDRPLLALVYTIPMSVFGENPIVWQLAALFSRWLFTLSVYGFLNSLWPQKMKANQLVTLLVLVFPGFKQQWISVIYTHVFLVFALYFYSQTLFIKSVKENKKTSTLTFSSILLSLFCMTAVEYVAGLELVKPFIIYMLINKSNEGAALSEKLGKTLRKWLPYLTSFLLFLFYRVFIASSVLYKVQQMNNLSATPILTLIQMVTQQFKNLYTSIIPVWSQIITPFSAFDFSTLFSKVYLVLLLFTMGVSLLFLLTQRDKETRDSKWNFQVLFGAVLSLLAAGLPFWAANLSPSTGFPNDRILMPYMLGSSMLIFSLLYLLSHWKIAFNIIFSILFSLSAGFQLYQANLFRNDWDDFQEFARQLSWRIPSLKENTLLVAEDLPLTYYSDNSLTAVFNWIYVDQTTLPQNCDDCEMPYLINFTESRLGSSLASLNPGTPVNHNYRTFTFQGSTDQMILLYKQTPGCVHVVNPDLDMHNPLMPSFLREYAQNSRVDLIQAEDKQNDVFFLEKGRTEVPDSWCYYYQKASLAADLGQWEHIVELAGVAYTLDDHPNDASEHFPFIEGFARSGDWNNAQQLSKATANISDLYHPMICKLWQTLNDEMDGSQQKTDAISQIEDFINCQFE